MCQILVFKRTKIGVLGEVCKDLLKIFFSGALPPDLYSGNSSPDLLFAQAAKGFSFLSHERKKRNKESSPAARISVKMEHVRLKHKNSELCSSNSLCFYTLSVLHFLNLKSMRPESPESLQHRFARCWVSPKCTNYWHLATSAAKSPPQT